MTAPARPFRPVGPGLRVEDIHPCDGCGGELGQVFHVLQASMAVIDVDAVNQLGGLTQLMGGHFGIARAFGPDRLATLLAEQPQDPRDSTSRPVGWDRVLLCQECFLTGGEGRKSPAMLIEAARDTGQGAA